MTLDVRAFWLMGALATGSFGLLVFFVKNAYPAYLSRTLAIFGAANIALSVNYVIHLGRAFTGQFLFYVVGATLVTTCLSLEYSAVCLLKRRRAWAGWIFGPPTLVFAICVWFTFVRRNISIELVCCNVVNMVLMALIANSLMQKEEGKKPFIDTLTGGAYALLAGATFGVVVDALGSGKFNPEYDFNCARSIFNNVVAVLAEGVIFPLFLLMLSERLNRTLAVQAMRDPLTGIYNRRAFEEIAFRELSGAARSGLSLSLLMIDLDRFKEVNDRCGHLAGDALLQAVAANLRNSLRDEDFLCRWGGDEFCALLPRARREQAEEAAKRVLRAFESFDFPHAGESIRITVSIGVASDESRSKSLPALVSRADKALYQAKGAGRNRLAFAAE